MTNYLYQLQERCEYLSSNIIFVTISVINSNGDIKEQLIQLNKNQLYNDGIDSKQLRLPPYKSKYYADFKADLRGDGKEITDLFVKGDFRDAFYFYFDGDMYGIGSEDIKTSKLIEKYGENIFGLIDDNKVLAYFIIKPSLQEVSMNMLKTGEHGMS